MDRRLARLLPVVRAARWRVIGEGGHRRPDPVPVGARIASAALGAAGGAIAGSALGAALPAGAVLAYAGWVGPSLVVERRAAAARRGAERALGPLCERLEALVAAGRPVETALVALADVPSGAPVLDAALRRAAGAYALGAPLFRALAADAAAVGLGALTALAAEFERARDLGRGSLSVVRNARDAARDRERARLLEAAALVEGKLMLTLVLCYLPALMLLVVVPLFLTLLDGLFG